MTDMTDVSIVRLLGALDSQARYGWTLYRLIDPDAGYTSATEGVAWTVEVYRRAGRNPDTADLFAGSSLVAALMAAVAALDADPCEPDVPSAVRAAVEQLEGVAARERLTDETRAWVETRLTAILRPQPPDEARGTTTVRDVRATSTAPPGRGFEVVAGNLVHAAREDDDGVSRWDCICGHPHDAHPLRRRHDGGHCDKCGCSRYWPVDTGIGSG